MGNTTVEGVDVGVIENNAVVLSNMVELIAHVINDVSKNSGGVVQKDDLTSDTIKSIAASKILAAINKRKGV